MEKTLDELIESLNSEEIMSREQYIEQEISIRVMKEVTNERFTYHDKQFERLESKMNWIIGLLVGGMILPVFLHVLRMV